MKAVIMAGGKGTRITPVSGKVPKPMIQIDGKPVLQHQIECLAKQDITDIILVIGYLGEQIEDFFQDGSSFGVHISYIRERSPLGTAGSLIWLKDVISEDFLLMNGDMIFNVDIWRFCRAHQRNNGLVTILTHPNDHPYDSSIIVADESGLVTSWLAKEDKRGWCKNRVNAGLHMVSPRLLARFDSVTERDLDRDVLRPLIMEQQLYVYDSPEYIKDMGTPDRYYSVTDDIRSGRVEGKNLLRRQKAVFLDRDGTINRYAGFLADIDDFKLLDGVSEAVRLLNKSGYLVIIVTNQPVIARGELTPNELDEIHNKMETLLGNEGAYVNYIFYCPHHPDSGFAGERPEYKTACACRKPKPGMLLEAAAKYNIDMERSWMVGDSLNDIEAGRNAGCRSVYIGKNPMEDIPVYPDLLSWVKSIIDRPQEYVKNLICRYPMLSANEESIIQACGIMRKCYDTGGKLLIAGNGGSSADANHIVGELMKGFVIPRKVDKKFAEKLESVDTEMGSDLAVKLQQALPAIALSNHDSLNTAFINDVDGSMCFAQQVNGYGEAGDVLLAISTSGNSKNVLYAAVTAKAKGMKVIGLTGKGGGRLGRLADMMISVNETETYRVQELHLPVYHCLCLMLESHFFS